MNLNFSLNFMVINLPILKLKISKYGFFYAQDFKNLTIVCPPTHYIPKKITAYRWVFDDLEEVRNFQPRYYLVPAHKLEKQNDTMKCDMLGLSFFVSKAAAIQRFEDLKEDMGKLTYKRFGTKIAEGHIELEDGLNDADSANKHGHFTHHLSAKAHGTFKDRFLLVADIP